MYALERTTKLIDGFESSFGMELLATTDWLITKEHCETTIESLIEGMKHWTGGSQAAKRKASLFDARSISIALERLNQVAMQGVIIWFVWHFGSHVVTLLVMSDYRNVRRIKGLRHAPHVNVGSWV